MWVRLVFFLGLPQNRAMLTRVRQVLQAGIEQGLHTGAQVYVSLRGQPVGDFAVGVARPDARYPWQSAGKPLAAVAIAQLYERGKLPLDDRLRRILTHTATGVAAYDRVANWRLLGDVIQEIDGREFSRYVREEIFLPVGMRQSSFGEPPPDGALWNTFRTPPVPLPWENTGQPGNGACGPVRELGKFYEALLAGTLLKPATLSLFTQRHREGLFDETFRHKLDWGLGFIVNSNRYGVEAVPYGFGRYASERTFGHGGAQSCMGFADPDRQLVVAWVCDGLCGEPRHHRRNLALNTAVYEDLGIGV